MHTYDDLLSKALLLNDKERALMAERLVSSLDPGYDINSEKEWQEEIERRINEIDKGKVKLLSWNTVKKQLR
ncbi:MAG: addiction module component, family protein [Ignavibacteriales bacterium]|nr:MAG: addiction module component, family protein [Ignavibacteriales bacterium]